MTQVKNLINKVAFLILGLMMAFTLIGGVTSFAAPATASLCNNTTDDANTNQCIIETPEGSTTNTTQNTIVALLLNIANFIIYIVAALAVIYLIYGGVKYLTDGGSGKGAEDGKKIILNACIGLVICLVAFSAVQIVINLTNGVGGLGNA
jgi:hypothetical protein